MGAERAVIATQSPGEVPLHGFADEVLAKIRIEDDDGQWILMGRAMIYSVDADPQWATAKLVHDANVVIDEVKAHIPKFYDRTWTYLQAGFVIRGDETITLECNTYDGAASFGSLIAFKVDEIDFQ